METDTTRASLPARHQIVDAFVNIEISNSDFLNIFAFTPPGEAQAALLRCRAQYIALARRAQPANATAASADDSSQWIRERDLLHEQLQLVCV